MDEILRENQVSSPIRTNVELSESVKAVDEKLKTNPTNADLWMERGLALADMTLFRESVEAFSKAISIDPLCGIYYRHRAHRHLSCWELEEARADFALAARLIPDNWDVWYHYGLSSYLLGEYEKALNAYKVCYEMSKTDDKIVAITDWYWMTLKRLGLDDEAAKLLEPITTNMDYGENIAYFSRLMIYKGIDQPQERPLPDNKDTAIQWVTFTYGLANYYSFIGEKEKSDRLLNQLLEMDKYNLYYAFGYLAAMVDKGKLK